MPATQPTTTNQDFNADNSKLTISILEDKAKLKQNAILCIKKILLFINYKHDVKRLKENYEEARLKFFHSFYSLSSCPDPTNQVKFVFDCETDPQKEIILNAELLSNRSEYFNALLNGHFVEGALELDKIKTIKITDISYETFIILSCMIQYGQKQLDWDELNFDLTADACIQLILATDKLFLVDLKDLFTSILLAQFLTLSNWFVCFKLAWYLNSTSIEVASIDCFLSGLNMREDQFYEEKFELLNQIDTNELSELELHGEKPDDLMNSSFLIDQAFESFKANLDFQSQSYLTIDESQERHLVEYFRKSLKIAISDIIKK